MSLSNLTRRLSLLAGFVLPTVCVANTPTLTLVPKHTVNGEIVRLGDISGISGVSPELQAQLAKIGLGPAPRPGMTRKIDRESISAQVDHQMGGVTGLHWAGAKTVIVSRNAVRLQTDALLGATHEQLLGFLRTQVDEGARVEIAAVAPRPEMLIPAGGEVSFSVRKLQARGVAKRMCVWVDVTIEGKRYTSIPVWYAVAVYQPVAVAKVQLDRNAPISVTDIAFEERNVAGFEARPLPVTKELYEWRTRRAIPAGQVVYESDIEKCPSVVRNQEIDVRVLSGSVVIDTKAVALADGHVGELISVQNPVSHQKYLVQIVDNRKAMAAIP